MRIRIAPRPEGIPSDLGAPELPTSKSHAQRALCLERHLPGEPKVVNLPTARDVQVLRNALSAPPGATLDLRDNGTAMRILSVLPAVLGERCTLDGAARLRERPLTAATDFLRRYGCQVGDGWPKVFDGTDIQLPEELDVDASLTTQVATGVLLGCGVLLAREEATRLVRVRRPAATRYLFVTISVLAAFGVVTNHWFEEDDLLVAFERFDLSTADYPFAVPLDASSYSFFATFLAMHGRETEIVGRADDHHPDWLFIDDVRRMWAAAPGQDLTFGELAARPDTFPCLVVLAALRTGTTRITGVPALRHKESDRIAAMARGLSALGVSCEECTDGLTVTGPLEIHERSVVLPAPDDHRIVMALALFGTRLPGGVEVPNAEAVEKSWPEFFSWLGRVSIVTPLP